MSILSQIKSPSDLSSLDSEEIRILCEEIRQRIILTTSSNGGHVGPNLGVVELTVALHLAFETPRDSLVWDVSHQGYVHKLLTGRNDEAFDALRQTDGYSGFLTRDESPHDAFGAGHAGTALSSALGMCLARDMRKEDSHVVAIAGDAAFTCGITLEALNNVAASTKRFILILNDNKWSIAKNVGAFSRYFNELITNPIYSRIHKDAETLLKQFPGGSSLINFLSKAKRDTKELLAPSSIFEKLGIRYLGPIDGHDIDGLVHFLEFAKQSDKPIVLHLLTEKGRGFPEAMKEPEKWHGAGPFDPTNGKPIHTAGLHALKYQDVFGKTLIDIASKDDRVVGITAAMPGGTGLDAFCEVFPSRFFDVGIAEEHAVLLAAGMASKGMRPVCAIYSTFLQRAYDQIIHDVCLQRLPVTFCMDRAGLSPNDGPTHHGLFDVSFLRCIPNAVVMQPRDEQELQRMMLSAVESNQPCFIRYPRGTGPGTDFLPINRIESIPLGTAQVIKEGSDWSFWALGDLVQLAVELADLLENQHGVSCSIVDARFVKPLDLDLLKSHCHEHRRIITLEDNVIQGGFGSAVMEAMNEWTHDTELLRFGWPDEFISHGSSVSSLRKKHRLDFDSILQTLLKSGLPARISPKRSQATPATL